MRWVFGVAAFGVVAAIVAAACSEDRATMDAPGGSGGTASSSSSTSTSTTSGWTTTEPPPWSECEELCDSFPVPAEGACRDCADMYCLGPGAPCECAATPCCEVFTDCESHDWDCFDARFDIAELEWQETDAAIEAESVMWCLEDRCADECDSVNTCGTDLGQPGIALDSCLTAKCCADFVPCYDDSGCNGCLQDPGLAGCDTNALWATYRSCAQSQCPVEVCGAGIGFRLGPLPAVECNKCLAAACCSSLVACVGGVVPDPPEAAVDLCVECIVDPDGPDCTDQAVAAAADAFNSCHELQCPMCNE